MTVKMDPLGLISCSLQWIALVMFPLTRLVFAARGMFGQDFSERTDYVTVVLALCQSSAIESWA